ncbi:MAG: hypothetical protein H6557_01995 [Lewinellaceae bacterium]|nr:hypothetical protein [Lewinellaceae bacterium]
MRRLSLLRLTFETEINPWEVPAFQAAVADQLGGNPEGLFDPPGLRSGGEQRNLSNPFAYPKAQFKMRRNHGRYQPLLLCLGAKVDQALEIFRNSRHTHVMVNGRPYSLEISEAKAYHFDYQAGEQPYAYNLFKYQALNSQNYRIYQRLDGEEEKKRFLENLLAKHLLTFARAVGWELDFQLEVKNLHLMNEKPVSCGPINYHCFDLSFRCPLLLPEYIGLGNAVAKGFGVVRLDRRGPS